MGTNQRRQIEMTDEEVAGFVERSRTATMATIGPTGVPHLVAMWYAVIDGTIWFETRAECHAYLFEFIEVFYNRQRRHSALDYLSPAAFEARYRALEPSTAA